VIGKSWFTTAAHLGWIGVLNSVVLPLSLGNSTLAQIVPDNTLGTENSIVTPGIVDGESGSTDIITGGATRGSNLFHSFEQFNVSAGNSAYFSSPSGINNILGRVSGGSASEINGTLGVLGSANLFLLNPNGILFGPNASLDVKGSFVGTTANAVQFEAQGTFSATDPQLPPVLTVNPSALLFNQIGAQSSIINRSVAPSSANPALVGGLEVPDGQSLLLVGGNVQIEGGAIKAPGGQVELAAIENGSAGLTVNGSQISLSVPDETARADIFLTDNAQVRVASASGGNITLTARNMTLQSSLLQTGIISGLGSPNAQAGEINLDATGFIQLSQGSFIQNEVDDNAIGNSGDILINTGSLNVIEGAQLFTGTNGQGNAGNIVINASRAVSFDGVASDGSFSGATSVVEPIGVGQGGDIQITAASLAVTNGARLLTSTLGQGDAGNITVNAADTVSLDGESHDELSSSILSSVEAGAVGNSGDIFLSTGALNVSNGAQLGTANFGRGNSGNIAIAATDSVTFDGEGRDGVPSQALTVVEPGAVGSGGDITITTGVLNVLNGASIATGTFGRGDAGNISITASDNVTLRGEGSQELSSTVLSSVFEGAVGNAGNISIKANSLEVLDGSQLVTFTQGSGNAGDISIMANDTVSFDGENSIGLSSAALSFVDEDTVGNSGNITIAADSLSVTSGAFLATSTLGQGNAGNISITANDTVKFDGQSNSQFPSASSAISTVEAGAVGNAGDITITTGSLLITNGAELNTSTSGQGDAGKISITANDMITFSGKSFEGLPSTAFSAVNPGAVGEGGDITITTGSLALADGAQLQAFTAGQGNAGNVTIAASGSVTLDGDSSGIFNTVSAGAVGNGGNITINAGSVSVSNGAELQTLTEGQGNAGDISITASDAVIFDGEKGENSDRFLTGALSSVEAGASGNGGNITITADSVAISNGAQLNASTSGQGNAGNITITASDTVTFDGEDSNGIPSSALSFVNADAFGEGGDISITSGSLRVANGATLATTTLGQGNAGDITLTARDAISFDGEGKSGFSTTAFSSMESPAAVNGGNITIDTGTLSVTNGAQLNASTFGTGNAGDITITARDAVTFDGESSAGESSSAFSFVGSEGIGQGGDVTITTGTLSVSNGALLATSLLGQGNAGNINIAASDSITVEGIGSNGVPSSVLSTVEAGALGRGGDITMSAGSLAITNGAELSASSSGTGDAGNIRINAQGDVTLNNGTVSTTATQSSAGSISITAGDISLLGDGDIVSSVSGGTGSGGNIFLSADSIIAFNDSDILSFARNGKGGNITLDSPIFFGAGYSPTPPGTDPLTLDGNGRVDINADGTVSGVITTSNPTSIQKEIERLPQLVLDTNQLLANSCVTRSKQSNSYFLVSGSGGMPTRPGDAPLSPYPTGDVRSVGPSAATDDASTNAKASRPWQLGDPILEPHGVYHLVNGRLILGQECP
jgi:filamentous hemagglutinin family protein